jgi:hypothetical protein
MYQCAHSPWILHILSSTSVPFTLTTVQVPNLELTHTKRITVHKNQEFQIRPHFLTPLVPPFPPSPQQKLLRSSISLCHFFSMWQVVGVEAGAHSQG